MVAPLTGAEASLMPLDYNVAPGWDDVKRMERFMLTPRQRREG